MDTTSGGCPAYAEPAFRAAIKPETRLALGFEVWLAIALSRV
jgi:hypothetical protein